MVDRRAVDYKTASASITFEYTNYTPTEVFIKTQSNVPISIQPNTNMVCAEESRPHLEIRQVYCIHSAGSINATYQLLKSLADNNVMLSEHAALMMKDLDNQYGIDPNKRNKINFKLSVAHRIFAEDIRKSSLVYSREADVVVTFDKISLALPHPNSSEGLQQFQVAGNKAFNNQAGIFVHVIDNDNIARCRYYHAGKHLITVPSDEDDTRASGVYCTVSSMKSDGLVDMDTHFLSFKEAEEVIGLYRSKEEAISHGNPEFAIKAEEQRNKAEEARSKAEERRLARELEEAKHEHTLETLRRTEELDRVKHALEIYKAENQQLKESIDIRETVRTDAYDYRKDHRKDQFEEESYDRKRREYRTKEYYDEYDYRRRDYYEGRSYDRKDTSELIKFIPAVILGALGAYALVSKGKSS